MRFEKAIQDCYGLAFRQIPADGKMRSFKIGHKEGFAILFESCGAFGCWDDRKVFQWAEGKYQLKEIDLNDDRKRSISAKKMKEYELLVCLGNAAADKGEPLSGSDQDIYLEALCKVIEAKNG